MVLRLTGTIDRQRAGNREREGGRPVSGPLSVNIHPNST